MSFPGEVLLPIVLLGAVPWSLSSASPGQTSALREALPVIRATFLATWLFMAAASYRQSVLVDHVVLALSPLGFCGVGILVARLLQSQRRMLALVFVQGIIVCTMLSILGSVGAIKSNTEDLAGLINAERLESDFALLAPRVPGATFNHYLARPISQIDYPDAGARALYQFDNAKARVSDPAAWASVVDSIRSVRRSGRRLWFMYPARWPLELSAGSGISPDSSSGLAVAKVITARLHDALVAEFGRPSRVIKAAPAPWSMELMSLELFDPLAPAGMPGGGHESSANGGFSQ
jgi:hypothetical protein